MEIDVTYLGAEGVPPAFTTVQVEVPEELMNELRDKFMAGCIDDEHTRVRLTFEMDLWVNPNC